MSSELAQLRTALEGLESYELPATYRLDEENDLHGNATNNATDNDDNGDADANDKSSTAAPPLLFHNPQLLQRYKSARNSYIQQRTLEMFLASLQKYDAVANTIPLPDETLAPTEREELKRRQAEVLEQIKGTMEKMTGGMESVRSKWQQFCEKREELVRIVEGMEREERKLRLEGREGEEPNDGAEGGADENDDEEGEITDEDVALQEEKLDGLRRRKLALENRLRSVRAEILDVEDDCHATKRSVNETRARSGRKPLDWRGGPGGGDSENGENGGGDLGDCRRHDEENEDVEYISAVARKFDAESAKIEEKSSELKKSSDFYDGVRELMEELGGVRILSSESIPASKNTTSAEGGGGEESPGKRQKLDENGEEGFVLTLMLLGSHILEITLSKSPGDKDGLHVSGAKLTTSTTFPIDENDSNGENNNDNEATTSLMETMQSISLSNLSFSKIMSQKPSVEVTVPTLDDLVSWSGSLEGGSSSSSSRGIRFVLVEAMARLRAADARVAELATLRGRYAARVYDVGAEPSRGGGYEQEAVCAVEEGITVALRMGADCPLAPGSVYVSEIFGVGGWEDDQLEALKEAVRSRRCRGPVEAMECMVDEIRRRSEGEEGWAVPGTPSLPRGKR